MSEVSYHKKGFLDLIAEHIPVVGLSARGIFRMRKGYRGAREGWSSKATECAGCLPEELEVPFWSCTGTLFLLLKMLSIMVRPLPSSKEGRFTQ